MAGSMPNAPLRICAAPGCPTRVSKGYCPQHQRVQNRRTSAHARGYDRAWERFRRETFPAMLRELGIPRVCGARLTPGPSPHSQCAKDGVVSMESASGMDLELHHEPPLEDWERSDPERVCDPMRVEFLCRADHSATTNRERRR